MNTFYSSRYEAAKAAVTAITATLKEQTGPLSMALPGGTTPVPLFDALAKATLPWRRLTVLPTDERWVPTNDPDSNERLLRSQLVDLLEDPPTLLSLRGTANDMVTAVAQAEAAVTHLRRPLDVVILGFGNDGHVASLFPDQMWRLPDPVLATAATPARHARLSLGYDLIANARWIALFFAGSDKMKTLMRAMEDSSVRDIWPLAMLLKTAGNRLHLFGAST